MATVEWLNNQADFNAGGTAGLTYQVRLFETTGCIEYAYGSMTMSAAGAADANSQNPNIGFSSSNAAGTVGSVTAAQSGTPAPTYNGASATPVDNLYTAGTIPVLTSAADGSRRTFSSARRRGARRRTAHLHRRHADRHDPQLDGFLERDRLRHLHLDRRRRQLHLRQHRGPERDQLRGHRPARRSTTYDWQVSRSPRAPTALRSPAPRRPSRRR